MSNMSPQVPELNRETWQYLEAQVRRWAEQYGKIYVVTGPLLEKSSESYNSIGENKVAVPEFFYKVILAPVIENSQTPETSTACSDIKTIGFILPNEKCSKNFMNYAVTVDEVEKRSGLDFFSLLPDQIENQTEAVLKAETL